eukprot:gene5413-5954_t
MTTTTYHQNDNFLDQVKDRNTLILGRNSQTYQKGIDSMLSTNAQFVSREHVKVTISRDRQHLFLQPISRLADTVYLNGQICPCNKETEIYIGDTISLLGRLEFFNFIVRPRIEETKSLDPYASAVAIDHLMPGDLLNNKRVSLNGGVVGRCQRYSSSEPECATLSPFASPLQPTIQSTPYRAYPSPSQEGAQYGGQIGQPRHPGAAVNHPSIMGGGREESLSDQVSQGNASGRKLTSKAYHDSNNMQYTARGQQGGISMPIYQMVTHQGSQSDSITSRLQPYAAPTIPTATESSVQTQQAHYRPGDAVKTTNLTMEQLPPRRDESSSMEMQHRYQVPLQSHKQFPATSQTTRYQQMTNDQPMLRMPPYQQSHLHQQEQSQKQQQQQQQQQQYQQQPRSHDQLVGGSSQQTCKQTALSSTFGTHAISHGQHCTMRGQQQGGISMPIYQMVTHQGSQSDSIRTRLQPYAAPAIPTATESSVQTQQAHYRPGDAVKTTNLTMEQLPPRRDESSSMEMQHRYQVPLQSHKQFPATSQTTRYQQMTNDQPMLRMPPYQQSHLHQQEQSQKQQQQQYQQQPRSHDQLVGGSGQQTCKQTALSSTFGTHAMPYSQHSSFLRQAQNTPQSCGTKSGASLESRNLYDDGGNGKTKMVEGPRMISANSNHRNVPLITEEHGMTKYVVRKDSVESASGSFQENAGKTQQSASISPFGSPAVIPSVAHDEAESSVKTSKQSGSDMVKSLLQQYECGICFETMACVVSLNPCGDNFCYSCIADWAEKRRSCPLCNTVFDVKQVLPNRLVESSIREVLRNSKEALDAWEARSSEGLVRRKKAMPSSSSSSSSSSLLAGGSQSVSSPPPSGRAANINAMTAGAITIPAVRAVPVPAPAVVTAAAPATVVVTDVAMANPLRPSLDFSLSFPVPRRRRNRHGHGRRRGDSRDRRGGHSRDSEGTSDFTIVRDAPHVRNERRASYRSVHRSR